MVLEGIVELYSRVVYKETLSRPSSLRIVTRFISPLRPIKKTSVDLFIAAPFESLFLYLQPVLFLPPFSAQTAKMVKAKKSAFLATVAGASLVAAHGYVNGIVVNGVYYRNYNPSVDWYRGNNQETLIGWRAENTDNGFVEPNKFNTADIICHRQAVNAKGYATVKAGDKINIKWDPIWPESHVGPVIDYLADCNGDCSTVSKNSLRFFKIDGAGYDKAKGKWAADVLRENGNSWMVQIPADLKPGHYVLRHEIIALHGAANPNGAQAYPQCINIKVEGSGSNSPSGVAGTSLYTANDPGILFNPWVSNIDYPVPGPALIPGAVSSIQQSTSAATRTASATPYAGGAVPTTTQGGSQSTPTALPTTTLVTTTAVPITTAPPAGPTQSKWGQCGGSGYTGPTLCAPGSNCQVINPWYHQCV